MPARDHLIAYGYVLCEDGKYRRPDKRTQVWQELENGGWLRFDQDASGNEVPEVYTIAPEYQGTSGLSKVQHPGCFVWVYPEDHVETIYKDAVEAMAKWAAEAAERKGLSFPEVQRIPEAPPTPEQLASMQNAQAGQAAAVMKQCPFITEMYDSSVGCTLLKGHIGPHLCDGISIQEKRHWWQRG